MSRLAETSIEFDLPVESGKVKEFAIAVGDNNPLYFDPDAARERGIPGCIAPPTFTVTQIWQVPREEREERLGANLDYGRVLHGEQEFVYHRPIVVGEKLRNEGKVADLYTKQSGERTMTFLVTENEYRDDAGELVLTTRMNLIHRS